MATAEPWHKEQACCLPVRSPVPWLSYGCMGYI